MQIKSKFDYLVKRHSRQVYTYALHMTRNFSDAEDITQEVLVKTWQNIQNFNFWSAKAWMMRTTHNQCIDWLRRARRTFEREIAFDLNPGQDVPDVSVETDPCETLVRMAVREDITEAIDQLPERLRSPFVLYEIQGFKYREIGAILGIPINTVKVNIMRARKELQRSLRDHASDN